MRDACKSPGLRRAPIRSRDAPSFPAWPGKEWQAQQPRRWARSGAETSGAGAAAREKSRLNPSPREGAIIAFRKYLK